MLPIASFFNTMPLTMVELCRPPPKSLATRTLSTLKLAGFLGHTCIHAYTIRGHKIFSSPNCLLATAAFIRETTSSLFLTSIFSEPPSTNSSNILTTSLIALLYPIMISLGCKPILMSSSAF
nr:hypothetical protein Iba_chr10bCG4270 [Ipomoea batatas]